MRINIHRACLVAVCVIALASAMVPAMAAGKLTITNLSDGETLRYPVALLRGTLEGGAEEELRVTNTAARDGAGLVTTALYRGRFKAFVELAPGANRINLAASDGSTATVTLRYVPMTNRRFVRLIYITDSNGVSLNYPTQINGDPQDYQAKLATAGKLYQTFTAERLNDLGLGRKTFRLETNSVGEVIVHTVRAPYPAAHYYALKDGDIWQELYTWLNPRFPMETAKNLVMIAFGDYNPTTGKIRALIALGGGGLATFNSRCLFTWPSSLQEVQHAFTDASRIDKSIIADDSIGRSRWWAAASTTMGAWLHELGHTFDLDHSTDQYSIMSRGFDYFNRFCALYDPSSDASARRYNFRENEIPYWDRTRSKKLAQHPWMLPD